MRPVPVERFLVPEPSLLAPAGFTSVRQQLTRGVPFTWTLAGDLQLVLVVPTGFASLWRDADPLAIASASNDETGPHTAPRGDDPREQVALRLIVRRAGITLASVPLAAGLWRIAPDGDRAAAAIELFLSGWLLHAGCVRGPGDYGSFVDVAWRAADQPVMQFDPDGLSLRRRGGYLP
jgi:hypothetical protein